MPTCDPEPADFWCLQLLPPLPEQALTPDTDPPAATAIWARPSPGSCGGFAEAPSAKGGMATAAAGEGTKDTWDVGTLGVSTPGVLAPGAHTARGVAVGLEAWLKMEMGPANAAEVAVEPWLTMRDRVDTHDALELRCVAADNAGATTGGGKRCALAKCTGSNGTRGVAPGLHVGDTLGDKGPGVPPGVPGACATLTLSWTNGGGGWPLQCSDLLPKDPRGDKANDATIGDTSGLKDGTLLCGNMAASTVRIVGLPVGRCGSCQKVKPQGLGSLRFRAYRLKGARGQLRRRATPRRRGRCAP